jgi:hypothetical protein
VFVLEGSENVMSFIYDLAVTGGGGGYMRGVFCVPLLQNVPLFYQVFFCSVKDATSLYVVYNTFVLEIKQGDDLRAACSKYPPMVDRVLMPWQGGEAQNKIF